MSLDVYHSCRGCFPEQEQPDLTNPSSIPSWVRFKTRRTYTVIIHIRDMAFTLDRPLLVRRECAPALHTHFLP